MRVDSTTSPSVPKCARKGVVVEWSSPIVGAAARPIQRRTRCCAGGVRDVKECCQRRILLHSFRRGSGCPFLRPCTIMRVLTAVGSLCVSAKCSCIVAMRLFLRMSSSRLLPERFVPVCLNRLSMPGACTTERPVWESAQLLSLDQPRVAHSGRGRSSPADA